MNKKGQVLVLFVLFIPIIIFTLILVFDSAYITINNNRLNNIAKDSVKYLVVDKKPSVEIEKFIKANDENIEIVEITDDTVYLKHSLDPIFGRFMGYDRYELEIRLHGYIENNKLITIEEKG